MGVLLPDGTVLLPGGRTDDHGTLADRFYPTTGEWDPTGRLLVARMGHRSVLLQDGRVLVSGGVNDEVIESLPGGSSSLTSSLLLKAESLSPTTAELYDPESGTFSATGTMVGGFRWGHAAAVLPDGRVLVAGGWNGEGPLASAELYDPATGTWRQTADLSTPRYEPSYAVLPDGRVLVAGGTAVKTDYVDRMRGQTSVETYDPATETWSPLSPMHEPRFWNPALTLADGRVLVAGAVHLTERPEDAYPNSEIYDPAADRWESPAPMVYSVGFDSGVAQLPGGRVLYVNGLAQMEIRLTKAQIFDLRQGRWLDVVQPETGGRQGASLTTLRDGRCLLSSGRQEAELFVESGWQPAETPTNEPSPTPTATVTSSATATVTSSATATASAAPTRAATATATAKPSPTATPPPYGSWSRTDHMLYPRHGNVAVRLQDGRVLVAGGDEAREQYATRAEIFDPNTNEWSDAGEMASPRLWATGLLLRDGRVLVIGGYDPTRGDYEHPFWPPPELFAPSDGSWTVLQMDLDGNYGSSHRLLPDGRVLLSGFIEWPFCNNYGTARSPTMVLDVETGEVVDGPDMGVNRTLHWSAALADGTVLLGGGIDTGVRYDLGCVVTSTPKTALQAYDQSASILRELTTMPRQERDPTLVPKGSLNHQIVLPDGRVMVTTGLGSPGPLIYDSASDAWTATAPSRVPRKDPVAALLPNGLVLFVSGGGDFARRDFTAELYDPIADRWLWAAGVQNNYSALRNTATTLLDGRLLLVGSIGLGADDRAMLYTYSPPRPGQAFAPAVYSH